MADFKEAFVAMWDNEGEIWGLIIRGVQWCYRIRSKELEFQCGKKSEWVTKTIFGPMEMESTEWHKIVEAPGKEVRWWEAWEWAKKNPDKTFWMEYEGRNGERRSGEFTYIQNDASVHNLLDGKDESKWFIPVEGAPK